MARHTVVVVVDAVDGRLPSAVVEHATAGVRQHFPSFAGFVDGRTHVTLDDTRLVQVVTFTDEDAWLAARDDDRWAGDAGARAFAAAVDEGRILVDARPATTVP